MKNKVLLSSFSSLGRVFICILGSLLVLGGCDSQKEIERFKLIDPAASGVTFSNMLTRTPDFNIINYLYFYDGGGVSIGDINNDGLPDIYLTANMGPNRLYLNKGNFKFEDITDKAGVKGSGEWTTGTTMADVNGDGLLDIYVCNVDHKSKEGRNELFINNGDTTFTESAAEYGLDFSGFSKQATFFDMDNDGDLDMYLLNHALHTKDSFRPAVYRSTESAKAGDRLYRNDGGVFKDVSESAGIYSSALGYGLGVTVSDINGDNYQDIYVSNDFHENDYLYINQGDGTFKELLQQQIPHTSRASMGNDIADINNDLKPDIAVVDMLPPSLKDRKLAVSSEPYEVYSIQREYGYHPQLIRNTLQLNLGTESGTVPVFADIAPLAGVHATDWSWSPLIFDMDNDGLKDLFITNGIYRRPNDMDYLGMVRTERAQQALNRGDFSIIDSMPHVKIPNAAYHNGGNLHFTNKADDWGLGKPSYSNGAAYGDLDNDGDLDLVVNNVNSTASIYRNLTTEQDSSSYLTIRLRGAGNNTYAIGSKVIAYTENNTQLVQLMPTRGFQSSVDPRIFFGFGDAKRVDSLKIIWPDGSETVKVGVPVNQQMIISQDTAKEAAGGGEVQQAEQQVLTRVESPLSHEYQHKENTFNGFNIQPLMPYQLSKMGPRFAVGDVNNDGREDLYICGAENQSGALFIQQQDGNFKKQEVPVFQKHAFYEDTDAKFFDANGDGSLDLYVVSWGNEAFINSEKLADRLYLNNGKGRFIYAKEAIPDLRANGSVVLSFDYDEDGDLDLFVGSRSVPESYGASPASYLLENQGDGSFKEVTQKVAPKLQKAGMIADAEAADLDGNGTIDLIVAGDWMPVTIFWNRKGHFEKFEPLQAGSGLWQSLHISDIDGDGDADILAGNMGLNTTLKATVNEPLVMFTSDFNRDGSIDPLIGQTKGDQVFPIASRDHFLEPFYFLRPKFPTYESFAGKSFAEIFGAERMRNVPRKSVHTLASLYIENTGDGTFEKHILPRKTQFAPILDFYTHDFNGDGYMDMILGGNLYDILPVYGGRYDASYGWYLKGHGNGTFSVVDAEKSGLSIDGEIRDITEIKAGNNKTLIMVGINNKAPVFYEIK